MSSAQPQQEPTQPHESEVEGVYDDNEEQLITERLQALGYIE